ncbi:MAG: UxaA family hydrolase [Negativicutes bacterium]
MTERTINAILISPVDDVVTVIVELTGGDRAVFFKNGEITQVPVVGTIPQYHKLAIRDIKKAETLRKYGEIMGQATRDIAQGSHVHDHNVASPE